MNLSAFYAFASIIASTAALLVVISTSKFALSRRSAQPSVIHRFCYFVVVVAALSPVAFFATPEQDFTIITHKTYADPQQILNLHPQVTHYKSADVSEIKKANLVMTTLLWTVFSLVFMICMFRYVSDTWKIRRIIKAASELRSVGRVRVLASQTIEVPFAYRTLGKVYVVVPELLVLNASDFLMAVRHEIQHHRQGDTIWTHFAYFLKSLFFWNPLVHLAQKRISEVQELACDEALIGRKGVNAHNYCHCLLTVAEHAMNPRKLLVGTAGMSMGESAQQLKWRVEMMSRYGVGSKFKVFGLLASLTTVIIASIAMASSGMMNDKKVTLMEAQELLSGSFSSDFPVEVNESVVASLNYFIGTPSGRKWVKSALGRKKQYDAMFLQKLSEYGVPEELLAVALMESGYKNIPETFNRYSSAGVWQIVPSTARRLGLQVDTITDERMDVTRATDAALRYLLKHYHQFGDWRLAIVGYNAGGGKVQAGIDETGSRDPWELIEAGYQGDPDYLAKVMAGVLILKNPDLTN